MPKYFIHAVSSPHENLLIREFSIFVIIIFFFNPAISLPEQVAALIFSLNVHGRVHGHQAAVSLLSQDRRSKTLPLELSADVA